MPRSTPPRSCSAHVGRDRLPARRPLLERRARAPPRARRPSADVERLDRDDPVPELLVRACVYDKATTPARSFTIGASFATRLRPSMTAFTSRTSNCLYAATRRGSRRRSASVERSAGSAPRPRRPRPRSAAAPRRTPGSPAATGRAARASDAAAQVRAALEQEPERREAARHVLRRIGAVDAEDQLLRPARDELALALEHRPSRRRGTRTRPGRSRSGAP